MRRCLRQLVHFMFLRTFVFGFLSLCAGKSSREKRRICHLFGILYTYIHVLCICVSYTGEERREEEEDTWILYAADKSQFDELSAHREQNL